ncbi:TMEM165/GDT1 family protein [Nonomuraea rhizosphaerae]|uniref:TMEM165/GDT1 family protein n=1 Tax=Nonomuraea rhizosphaerae TaxID=2665663 RepID=UPI001C5D998B|nr:TMEM165/GDT1 family protein [Nonomuraea rhizosphaerae]
MSNGARHALGVVAGLLLSPLIAVTLAYGVWLVSVSIRQFQVSWLGLLICVAAGVLLALLVSSRLSPLASLIGGLLFTAFGLLPILETTGFRVLPESAYRGEIGNGFLTLTYSGFLLVLGVLMLGASAFPSRWRGPAGRAVAAQPAYGVVPPYGGAGDQGISSHYQQDRQERRVSPQYPPQGPGDATRPMHRE